LSVCSRSSWLPTGLCDRTFRGVELSMKDDAGRLRLGLLEQIADPRRRRATNISTN
jgi:hypothetical protein